MTAGGGVGAVLRWKPKGIAGSSPGSPKSTYASERSSSILGIADRIDPS